MLVVCKFMDENNNPKGRAYTYKTSDVLCVNEIVLTIDNKKVVVVAIDEQNTFTGDVKTVSKIINADTDTEQMEFDNFASGVLSIPDLTVTSDSIAIIEQLPVITEQLDLVSLQIDEIVNVALNLECNEETRKDIKTSRAKLNSLFNEFEKRRIFISKEVNKPYELFNQKYKTCVSDKFKFALTEIDKKTNAIEQGIKDGLSKTIEAFFYEYANSLNLDWITWENSKIRVGLSDNKTNLMKQATTFLDKIAQDILVIDTQDRKNDIEIEYRKSLNLMDAIKIVDARYKAIKEAEEKRKQIEIYKMQEQEKLKFELEQKKLIGDIPINNIPIIEPLKIPTIEVIREPIKIVDNNNNIIREPIITNIEQVQEKSGSVCFKVTGTISKIQKLKQFLIDNDYLYEQIPLKNIIREDAI